jgi:hypothetical protein
MQDQENTPVSLADDTQVQQELAKPEDASTYIEDRKEEEKADSAPEDAAPQQQKRASRYERLKRARGHPLGHPLKSGTSPFFTRYKTAYCPGRPGDKTLVMELLEADLEALRKARVNVKCSANSR